jgi:hypothetical protein
MRFFLNTNNGFLYVVVISAAGSTTSKSFKQWLLRGSFALIKMRRQYVHNADTSCEDDPHHCDLLLACCNDSSWLYQGASL